MLELLGISVRRVAQVTILAPLKLVTQANVKLLVTITTASSDTYLAQINGIGVSPSAGAILWMIAHRFHPMA